MPDGPTLQLPVRLQTKFMGDELAVYANAQRPSMLMTPSRTAQHSRSG